MPNDEMNTQTSNIFEKTTDVSNFSDVLFPQNLNILITNVNWGFYVLRPAQFNSYNDKKKSDFSTIFFFSKTKEKTKTPYPFQKLKRSGIIQSH